MQPLPPMTATFPLKVALTIAAPGNAADKPLDTVGAVDLDRYFGRWHEIAGCPSRGYDPRHHDPTPQPEAGGER